MSFCDLAWQCIQGSALRVGFVLDGFLAWELVKALSIWRIDHWRVFRGDENATGKMLVG